MAYINSVILQGNLVRDPELTQLSSGASLASFTIAINRSYPKKDGSWQSDVSYFDCQTWGTEAQRCRTELQKGAAVKITGRLQQDRWQDREGHGHSKIKVVTEYFEAIHREPKDQAAQTEIMHAKAYQGEQGGSYATSDLP